ncbi:ExbD/TolR family protein [Erythrobacter sp. W53]|uniref:ExbD/TolR family protein n=1 Tax=Erythrobacter sp. W53 TaxID=3425947 RepID=UPI003D7679D7
MAMSGGSDDGSPMMEMNMTPLIDVLLVLLIMFIITIPVATHSVDIDLPQPSEAPLDVVIEPDKNKLILTQQDVILWNGEAITEGQLVGLLQESMQITPEPELQFEPEALSSYEKSVKVLNIIKASGVTKFGFVGNERYRTFGKAAGAQ